MAVIGVMHAVTSSPQPGDVEGQGCGLLSLGLGCTLKTQSRFVPHKMENLTQSKVTIFTGSNVHACITCVCTHMSIRLHVLWCDCPCHCRSL